MEAALAEADAALEVQRGRAVGDLDMVGEVRDDTIGQPADDVVDEPGLVPFPVDPR